MPKLFSGRAQYIVEFITVMLRKYITTLILSVARRAALTVPPIRRLYERRNQLAASNEALCKSINELQAGNQTLQEEHRKLTAENQALQEELTKLTANNQAIHEEHGKLTRVAEKYERIPAYIRLRRRNMELVRHRSALPVAYAIIGSSGRTATQWITDAFNLHNRVFFSHGGDLEPRKKTASEDRTRIFLRMLREIDSFDFTDIDGYFDLLEAAKPGCIAYGNVHGLGAERVYQAANQYRRRYYACAIVRHPIIRVNSFVRRFEHEIRITDLRRKLYLQDYKRDHNERLGELSRQYGVDCSSDNAVLFLQAVNSTFADQHYLNLGMPVFNMERLVSDVDYFLKLFSDATALLVEPDRQYVSKLRRLAPVDRLGRDLISARFLFSDWAEWKRKYFFDEMEKTQLLDVYESLGYSLAQLRP